MARKTIRLSDYDTISKTAKLCGIPRGTLYAAVERGEIETETLASGTEVIRVADAEAWQLVERSRGPAPAAK